MLRVLMLSTDLEPGGLPLRLVRLASKLLQNRNIEPIVGCLSRPGPLSNMLAESGIDIFSCDAAGPWDATCLARLTRHVARFDPDVIHASLCHANLAARLVGRHDRDRPIITATVTIERERAWHRWAEAVTIGRSNVHVANSRAVAAHLRDELCFPPDRLVVIPNGMDLDVVDRTLPISREAHDIKPDAKLIVWAGRMDPIKGLDTFVDAVRAVEGRVSVHAVLLGDGPERPRIASRISDMGLSRIIRLPGWRDDVTSWLKTADCLLFPSRTEGCPNVVLEAMACGCPVIASDIPAIRELIDPGVSGWLCSADDVGAFEMALKELCENPARGRILAAAARTRARTDFTLDLAVERWTSLYHKTAL